MMRVYHRRGAGRPIRIAWTLEEIGAPYDLVTMTSEEAAVEGHQARHPLGLAVSRSMRHFPFPPVERYVKLLLDAHLGPI
jgi:hypothetical protein